MTTISGTSGDDFLSGDSGNDEIYGLEGNDVLNGGGGDDILEGGEGDDHLEGGVGNDLLDGGSGNDVMVGGAGDDVYVINPGDGVLENADEGTDEIRTSLDWGLQDNIEKLTATGAGNTYLGGNALDNVLTGNSGNNYLVGEGGNDSLDGGDGQDVAAFRLPAGTTGTLRVVNAGDGSFLVQLVQADGAFEDVFAVTPVAHGSATVTGLGSMAGLGTDTVTSVEDLHFYVDNWPEPTGAGQFVNLLLDVVAMPVQDGFAHVEGSVLDDVIDVAALYPEAGSDVNINVHGGLGDDIVIGSSGLNYMRGQAGNDTLYGEAGDDGLSGDEGDDSLHGGDGNDGLQGNDGNDSLSGDAGNDSLDGGAGNDSIHGGAGNDYLIGGAGNDIIDGGAGANDVASFQLPEGTLGAITVVDGSGDDAGKLLVQITNGGVTQTFLRVTLTGPGNAIVEGVGIGAFMGTDIVSSADQLHIFVNTPGGALPGQFVAVNLTPVQFGISVAGSENSDTIDLANYAGAVNANGNRGDDVITGTAAINSLQGGAGNDTLNGEGGNDVLNGQAGNDTLFGGVDNDTLIGAAGSDTLNGGDGDDVLIGAFNTGFGLQPGDGADILRGDGGNDVLRGGDGDDLLEGGDGDDNLRGDAGSDTMDGGAGEDFVSLTFSSLTSGITFDARAIGATSTSIFADPLGGTDTLISIEKIGISGTNFDDVIHGSEHFAPTIGYANQLYGNGGNDQLHGASGNDFLDGGTGNDVLEGRDGNDDLIGGAGDDVLHGGAGDDVLFAVNSKPFQGAATFLNFAGSTFNGGEGFDYLAVGGEVDFRGTLSSIEGIDLLNAFTATAPGQIGQEYAELHLGAATFGLLPVNLALNGVGSLVINLGAGNFDASQWVHAAGSQVEVEVFGDDSSQTMVGSTGNDRFGGGFGSDVFTGGAGSDQFEAGDGQHTVLDFTVGEDRVDLTDMNFTSFEQVLPYLSQVGADVVFSRLFGGVAQTMTLLNVGLGDLTADSFVFQDDIEDDTRIGTDLADELFGAFGNDVLEGRGGDDYLFAGDGNDTLRGGLGSDRLFGGAGNDFLTEGSGDNGPFGDDLYDGGEGNDRVSMYTDYGPGATVDLRVGTAQNTGMGNDTFVGIEHITATYNHDTLTGNEAANWFWTFNGTDVLSGNGGNDHFTVGQGDKTADGGTGSDTIEISDTAYQPLYTASGIIVSLALQGAAQATGVGNWTLTNMENLGGSWGADRLTGDANANILAGAEGNDRLIGGGGDDILAGDGTFDFVDNGTMTFVAHPDWAGGDDFLEGGAGNDTIYGGGGNDVVRGGAGSDQLYGGDGNDQLRGGSGVDSFDGGANTEGDVANGNGDRISFYDVAATQGVVVDLRTGVMSNDGYGNVEIVTGIESLGSDSAFADTFYGNDGSNALLGNVGDTLSGFGGDDWIQMSSAAALADGGDGVDDLVLSSIGGWLTVDSDGDGLAEEAAEATDGWNVNLTTGQVTDGYGQNGLVAGFENVEGSEKNDTIIGDASANQLSGGDGNDLLEGGAGNDRLDGGTGADTMSGGAGDDVYEVDQAGGPGQAGDGVLENADEGTDEIRTSLDWGLQDNIEKLTATGAGNTYLGGNALDNVLTGNSGNNYLVGEGGNDSLDGGDGQDVAAFRLPAGTTGTLRVVNAGDGSFLVQLVQADGAFEDVFAVTPIAHGSATVTGLGSMAGLGTDTVTSVEDLHFYVDNWPEPTGAGQFVNLLLDVVAMPVQDGFAHVEGSVLDDVIDVAALYPEAGSDVNINVHGGLGDDIVIGSSGLNYMRGQAGNDTLYGEAGDDGLSGDEGDDSLHGGDGNDGLQGNDGNDSLSGDAGNDSLDGGAGNDSIHGGAGNDYLIGGAGNDIIDGGAGANDVASFQLPEGTLGAITVVDGSGDDAGKLLVQITNGGVTQTFLRVTLTGPGNAIVEGVGIGAFMGTDIVSSADQLHIFVNTPGGALPGQFVAVNLTPVQFGISVAGSENSDTIDLANYAGAVNANGNRGDDVITGTAAINSLQGGAGNDTLNGEGGNDVLNGQAGNDTLFGGVDNDTLIGAAGSDTLNGGDGDDVLIGAFNTGFGLQPGDGADILRGDGGNDVLRGGDGDDLLEGGDGDDNLRGDAGSDTMDGGAGEDFVSLTFSSLTSGITFDARAIGATSTSIFADPLGGTDTLISIEKIGISGTNFDDVIHGSEHFAPTIGYANQLYGNGGNDQLHGASGNDFLDGGTGNDVLEGRDGNDDLIGGAGDDVLHGGAGDDFLIGDLGDDLIDGGTGADDVAVFNLPASTVGSLRAVDGTGSDAGKIFIERVNGAEVEVIAMITVTGEGTIVQGLGSAAFLGTDTIVNVDSLVFSVSTADPASDVVVQLAAGIVSDGYIAGSTVYIDANDNGVLDVGEASTVTDASGNFAFASASTGTIRAVGGINVDTGLPNLLTLTAPEGSSVINPLTTLVQAIVEQGDGAVSLEQAQEQVKLALGLASTLDLANLDIVLAAATNPWALEAQKAAVMIATILVGAGEAAGTDGAEAAITAALDNLAGQVSESNAQVDLTDSATITEIVAAGLPAGTDVSAIVAILEEATDTISTAVNVDEIADAQGEAVIALDETAPDRPSMALSPESDSGASQTDRLTSDITPTLRGTAEAGSVIRVYDGSVVLASTIAGADGSWQATVMLLAGEHELFSTATDASGNESSKTSLSFVIDTAAAAPETPNLESASDTGASQTDNLTNNVTPAITGSGAEAGAIITLYASDGATILGSGTADFAGAWSIVSSTLAQGTHSLTVKQTDLSGNVSAASTALSITIDLATAPPVITSESTSAEATPLLTGSAEAGASIAIFDSTGAVVGSTLADSTGVWSYRFVTPLAEGLNGFSVTATDEAGNISSDASTTISVATRGVTLNGGQSDDVLTGTAAADTISGNGGDDMLRGQSGNDRLFGLNGDDFIDGGAGNDLLAGGKGSDILFGGHGADVFVFGKSGGSDVVWDFQIGTDKLQLEDGLTVKKYLIGDVDGDGFADLTVQFSNGSVTLLGIDAPLDNSSFLLF